MKYQPVPAETSKSTQAVLGYLNFSAGAHDPQLFAHLSKLYRFCGDSHNTRLPEVGKPPLWLAVTELLSMQLDWLQKNDEAFIDTEQAKSAIELIRTTIFSEYKNFHQDLLYHQDDSSLFNPFFLGRVFEHLLCCMSESGQEDPNLAKSVIEALNDYVGYRPVAALETERKMELYSHERCRPIPIYIRGAGVAFGPYEQLIRKTLDILSAAPASLLAVAQFDLEQLEELAIDPRPYDFEHPVNKRPNYQFGLWDPHCLDNRGFYTRFVVQQITIDVLRSRIDEVDSTIRSQRLFEAAAALAGTILMASAVSGSGPDAYSSEVTLNTLMPVIAGCRDSFYLHLLQKISTNDGDIGRHLRDEAKRVCQPFGGVRQYLNTRLARCRARQLEHVHLAKIFAQMGYPDAAARQTAFVPAASARMASMIKCLLTDTEVELNRGGVEKAVQNLSTIVKLLQRGIECGAIVDPWNILGFDGNFSLFPAPENSVPDHRIGELMEMMDSIFSQFARGLCLAAAADDQSLQQSISKEFDQLTLWWDQFAANSVSSIDAMEGGSLHQAATAASEALAAWQRAGTRAGDVRFWQPYVERFGSPKAYVLVIDALLDQRDFVASMNLLMHWLSQSEQVELQQGSDLFHAVASRWLDGVLDKIRNGPNAENELSWILVAKFFDFLDANAGSYGEVPQLQQFNGVNEAALEDIKEPDEEGQDDLYSAAYEEVIYRDSTKDGIDGDILGDQSTDNVFGIQQEAHRISDRLGFLVTVARLWKRVALTVVQLGTETSQPVQHRFSQWLDQILKNRREIARLMQSVANCDLPQPTTTPQSLIEYDRHRMIREALLERIIDSHLAHTEVAQFLVAAGAEMHDPGKDACFTLVPDVIRAALKNSVGDLRKQSSEFADNLSEHSLLYVPTTKGGNSLAIADSRSWQRSLRLLLAILPRMGMLKETFLLLETCAEHERKQPVGAGAVTEFDQIFCIANKGMIECVVASVQGWVGREQVPEGWDNEQRDRELVNYLEQMIETMTQLWLDHSQTLRLSVLEKVQTEKKWSQLLECIESHGHDMFTQTFLNLGNLRAILHRGVSVWVEETIQSRNDEELNILTTIDSEDEKRMIVEQLQLIIEAIVENYAEYRDYNGTTTQSDRGELLYTLLDMLRLRVSYDRVAWNLIPAIQVHEILLRRDCTAAAGSWRIEMMHRTAETADELIGRLHKLEKKYGMRLSTVSDRLNERFVRALEIDRAKVLIKPAVDAVGSNNKSAIESLQQYLDELTREPTGAGLDLPQWLAILEDEVDRIRDHRWQYGIREEVTRHFPQVALSRENLQQQLDALL